MKKEDIVEIDKKDDIIIDALNEEENEFTKTLPKIDLGKVEENEDSIDYTISVSKEDFYGKESKNMLPIIIGIIILMCIGIGYILIKGSDIKIGNKENIKEEPKHEDINKTVIEEETVGEQEQGSVFNELYGALYFYKDDNTLFVSKEVLTNDSNKQYLGTYNCVSTACNTYKIENSNYYSFDENTVLISDNNKGFIYNYSLNKILTNSYSKWYKLETSPKTYLLAVDQTTNIYSNKGNNITNNQYNKIGNIINNKVYEHNDLYIIASKDNKVGVINIKENTVLIDLKYDAVNVEENNIFTVKENNKWYPINTNGEKKSQSSYDNIVLATASYMMVIDKNSFDIVDYTGESLIKETISAPLNYERHDQNGNRKGIEISEVENNSVTILIGEEAYRFNINTFSIIKYSY